MSIITDTENGITICTCECCGEIRSTTRADGLVPTGWITGQLWLDLNPNVMRQLPLAFCEACLEMAASFDRNTFRLTALELPPEDPPAEPEPEAQE